MSHRALICAVRGHAWTTWRQAVLLGARRPICARCGALKTTGRTAPATLPAAGSSPFPGGGRPPQEGRP